MIRKLGRDALHERERHLHMARNLSQGAVGIGASFARACLLISFIAVITSGAATGQTRTTTARPPIGDYGSPPDAMIFYLAHGADGACGPGCSDWIAAEGTVEWDTHKRLIAILDRLAGRKLPLVINTRGQSSLNVAVGMGRILHERGIDTMEGATDVTACTGKPEADCFALKRPGGPLDATLNTKDTLCDIACVLILAGGIHRSLPSGTRVILTGMEIHNRLAPNVSDERREGLTTLFGQQFRLYLRQMGIDSELLDIVDHNAEQHHATELAPSDWTRLHIVTTAP
jgi:hypothetical protein